MDKFKPEQLQFSDVAISHFSGLLKKEDGNKSIRIGVKKAGCSGYEYFPCGPEGLGSSGGL